MRKPGFPHMLPQITFWYYLYLGTWVVDYQGTAVFFFFFFSKKEEILILAVGS
eukprot:SAG11_NODE_105_length_16528_cov_4.337635_6_plen_53_part_00